MGFFAVVFLVFYALPVSQKNYSEATSTKPSAECFITYSQSSQCKEAVDKYYTKDKTTNLLFMVVGIIVVMGILDWFYVTGWVKSYAIAAEQITQGSISASAAIIAYAAISPLLGMLLIQRAFNQR